VAQALVRLLKGAMFSRCKSIIVYCTRRDQTTRVATLIRTQMKEFYDDSDSFDDSDDGGDTPPRNQVKKKSAKKKGMHSSCSACAAMTGFRFFGRKICKRG